MPIIHAIVLGLVQGFSEFLPISSSGHLLLVPWLFDWNDFAGPDGDSVKKTFDVALHLGTFVAVLGYFWRDVAVYVREGTKLVFSRKRPTTVEGRLAWFFVLATVPAALVGAVFEDVIDTALGTPLIIALSLIGFGLLLGWADRLSGERELEEFGASDAVKTGIAQTLALNPGTSRSGITITAARWLGFNRDAAARISFTMSLPVIAGAVLVKSVGLFSGEVDSDLYVPMAVGVITSGLSGWFAVWGTLKWIRTHSFMPFVIYRVALGAFMLLLIVTGVRSGSG
ncbi:undecaprenyl-diphosphate phosphatase [Ilumatobacter nonamiensis]|uniref:undecaprenyl-diphosphate phosphatase n=1 Tax=Ilumatobacter nonamiensis TaxID=467093 RepID=UPI000345C110|nr:undecaprenyl-diphosphate phosphatase [Ilumatobacter nonamiensis]